MTDNSRDMNISVDHFPEMPAMVFEPYWRLRDLPVSIDLFPEMPAAVLGAAYALTRDVAWNGRPAVEPEWDGPTHEHPAMVLMARWWNARHRRPDQPAAVFAQIYRVADDEPGVLHTDCEAPRCLVETFPAHPEAFARCMGRFLIGFVPSPDMASRGPFWHDLAYVDGRPYIRVQGGAGDLGWMALQALAEMGPDAWHPEIALELAALGGVIPSHCSACNRGTPCPHKESCLRATDTGSHVSGGYWAHIPTDDTEGWTCPFFKPIAV